MRFVSRLPWPRTLALLVVLAAPAGLLPLASPAGADPAPRGPIVIHGDESLCDPLVGGFLSGVRNCSDADGSAERPYRISDWLITGSQGVAGPLTDATISTLPYSVQILATTKHIVLHGNQIAPPRGHGGVLVVEAPHVVIDHNGITGASASISVFASPGARILRNDVLVLKDNLAHAHGILVHAADVEVRDNIVALLGPAVAGHIGFVLDAPGLMVDGNRIDAAFNPSLYLDRGALGSGVREGLAGFGPDNYIGARQVLVIRDASHRDYDFSELPATPLAVLDSDNVSLHHVDAPNHPVYIRDVRDLDIQDAVPGGRDFVPWAGIGALGVSGSARVTIRDCHVVTAANRGIAVDRSTDVLIEGCELRGKELPPLETVQAQRRNYHVGTIGVHCERSDRVTIRDNQIRDFGTVGLSAGSCDELLVEGNRFADRRTEDATQIATGPVLHDLAPPVPFSVTVRRGTGARIVENEFLGMAADPDTYTQNAIAVTDVADLKIERNVFDGLDGLGVFVNSGEALLTDNEFSRIGLAAVYTSFMDAQLRLVGNDFASNAVAVSIGGYPPVVSALGHVAVFRNNNFEGNGVALHAQATTRPIDARENWWGNPDGPSLAGPGTGDAVLESEEGAEVLLEPWLTKPADR